MIGPMDAWVVLNIHTGHVARFYFVNPPPLLDGELLLGKVPA